MSASKPGREQLSGYIVRDYEHLMAALAASRESQRLTYDEVAHRMGRTYLQQVFTWLNGAAECRARRLFALADALGYDLALIPREDAISRGPEVWSGAVAPGGYVCAAPDPGRPDDICGMPVESEPCPDHATAFWGEHPAHPTCIDVSNPRAGQMPGSEWVCGPDCPRRGTVI